MSVDEYRELYLKTAAEIAEAALKPKAKKYLPGHNPGSAKGQGMKAKARNGGKRKKETEEIDNLNLDGEDLSDVDDGFDPADEA
jgi:hypothetical protein